MHHWILFVLTLQVLYSVAYCCTETTQKANYGGSRFVEILIHLYSAIGVGDFSSGLINYLALQAAYSNMHMWNKHTSMSNVIRYTGLDLLRS